MIFQLEPFEIEQMIIEIPIQKVYTAKEAVMIIAAKEILINDFEECKNEIKNEYEREPDINDYISFFNRILHQLRLQVSFGEMPHEHYELAEKYFENHPHEQLSRQLFIKSK